MIRVRGNCPMGCGQTLSLDDEGHVICTLIGCSDPCALDQILHEDAHEPEHLVQIGTVGFTVRHPLHERRDDRLMLCHLTDWLTDLNGPPWKPGTYRVRADDKRDWTFEEVR